MAVSGSVVAIRCTKNATTADSNEPLYDFDCFSVQNFYSGRIRSAAFKQVFRQMQEMRDTDQQYRRIHTCFPRYRSFRTSVSVIALAASFSAALTEAGAESADRNHSKHPHTNVGALKPLLPFSTLDLTPKGSAALAANQQVVARIYVNSTIQDKIRAAYNNIDVNDIQNSANIYFGVLGKAIGTRLQTNFYNHHGVKAMEELATTANTIAVHDASVAKDVYGSGSSTKTKFVVQTPDTYGRFYTPLAPNSAGNPRPFQTTAAILNNPWASQAGVPAVLGKIQWQTWFGQNSDYPNKGSGGLQNSAAFPSGHSTFGNTFGLLYANLVPELYREFLLSGIEFAYSRNVIGAHYPLDSIGGRLIATHDVAKLMDGDKHDSASFPRTFEHARREVTKIILEGCGANASTVTACIANGTIAKSSTLATDRARYRYLLTYDLPSVGPTDVPMTVPSSAAALLQTRFPYLSKRQIMEVLRTTALPSGSPLDDGSGWARLNLFDAAGGYGALTKTVAVTMDAAEGGFNALDTWDNDISGKGGLRKQGTGSLVLTGNNTYSGGTVVAGGTLSSLGTLAGAVTIAPSAAFVNAGSLDTGSRTLTNTGTLTNMAGADITGAVISTGTIVNDGTITGRIVSSGSLTSTGTVSGDLVNTGSLQASGRIDGTLANAAAASVQITAPLAGVTSLTNNGLIDLGGTAFAVGSLSGSAMSAVIRNGPLAVGSDNGSTVYAGTIVDGSAVTSLVKTGTGTLALTGRNTYSGGTAIDGGTLIAKAASLGSGPVVNNAALVIDQPSDGVLASPLYGTGRHIKEGAGTLTYTGAGSFSGPTLVREGGLVVNGSLAHSSVAAGSDTVIGGTGTVGGLNALPGSTVAPGAKPTAGSLGTLSVAGPLSFAPGSTYRVDTTAGGAADAIATRGIAVLQGGTVQVTAAPGHYAPRTPYRILSASRGVAGQFEGANTDLAFLTPFLSYGATDVILTLARNDLRFAAVAATRNQAAAANAVQASGVGNRLYDAVAVLSADQARTAFDVLSGEVHASTATVQAATAALIREAGLDRLRWGEAGSMGSEGIGQRFAPGTTLPAAYSADLPGRAAALSNAPTRFTDPPAFAVWGQGFGTFGSTASDGNAARLDRQTSGFVLGADAKVTEVLGGEWRVGLAGAYTFTTFDVAGRLASGTIESGYGMLYAGGSFGALQLRLGAAYGGSNVSTRRAVTFAGFQDQAGATYGGDTLQGFGEIGYRFGTALSYVEPFAGFAAIRIGQDRFGESGGAAALTGFGRDTDLATSTFGLQARARLDTLLGGERPVTARASIGYRRAYGDVVPAALLAFGQTGQPFLTAGIPIDRDAAVAQAGLDWQMAPATLLSLSYTGQVGGRAQDHGVKGAFLYRF